MNHSITPCRFVMQSLALVLFLLFALELLPSTAHATWLFSYAPNMVTLTSGKRNNVFIVGDQVSFTMAPSNYGTYNASGMVTYEVRDYWGNVVDSGTVLAPTATTSSTITSVVTQPGWYKLNVHGPVGVAPWGDSVGSTTFCIFRNTPNFPLEPDPNLPNNSGAYDGDPVARGVTGMGPQRHPVTNVADSADAITQLQTSIGLDEQYYTQFDPQRPRPLLIEFPNGVYNSNPTQMAANLAGLKAIVQQFHNQVKYWEPLNEPNGEYNGAQYITNELIPFYNTVKSVDPTCKVLGPAVVTIGPYGLNWLDGFFAAGGGKYIDALSFHCYNNVLGDLTLANESFAGLNTLLTKYGLQNIEKWQTEQGYFAACYGAYEPRLQGRWTMLQMMSFEQNGIPKEHNVIWYDVANGFWDEPAFFEQADGLYSYGGFEPSAALMRVWSEELYGTNFSQALDFGPTGDKMYIGSLFSGQGKQVAAFMSNGRTDGSVTLNVNSGSSLDLVSAFGVTSTLPVTNGTATLPVPELPVYVELASGQTISVVPQDLGQNLALQTGVSASSSGDGLSPINPTYPNSISKITNGVLENWYYNQGNGDFPWMDDTATFPAWVQINLPQAEQVSHVIIYSGVPWQQESSLLDYQLQYLNANSQWVTISHVTEPTPTESFFTPPVFTTVDSYYSDRSIFEHDFAPVTTSAIRLLVNNTTYGGAATADVVAAGGQPGPHNITLREVEIYGPSGNVAASPPNTPTGLAATPGNASVALTWNAVSGATSYNIKRSTINSGLHSTVVVSSNTNYIDTSVVNGTGYFYVVSAVGPGGESADSLQLAATPRTPPASPADLTAAAGNGVVNLSWSSERNVAWYCVKRSTIEGGPYLPVGKTRWSTYSDTAVTNGTTYYYVLSAIGLGGTSIDTNEVNATPASATTLAIPTGLTPSASDGSVSLNWTSVNGATSYNIKRSLTTGGPYSIIGSPTAPTYTDNSVTDGTTYYYVVSATASGTESANSSEVNATPTAQSNGGIALTASPTGLGVTLTWTSVPGTQYYDVQRSLTTGGSYSSVANIWNGATYIDPNVSFGTTYYYIVIAHLNNGTLSAQSNEANATPTQGASTANN